MISKVKKPIISEKSYNLAKDGRYTFKVSSDVNKYTAKSLIEEMYKVKVISVNTAKISRKIKKIKGVVGIKPSYKKIIVQLDKNNTIDLFEIEKNKTEKESKKKGKGGTKKKTEKKKDEEVSVKINKK